MARHRLMPRATALASVRGLCTAAVRWSSGRFGHAPLCSRVIRAAGAPALTLAVIAPLILSAVAGAAPRLSVPALPLNSTAVAPVTAATITVADPSGMAVVAVARRQASIHVVAETAPVHPQARMANHVGVRGIPAIALSAYRNAEQMMAASVPGCGIGWNLLAGIGRIESMHANRGATDTRGTVVQPIYGPLLDGALAGNEVIVQSSPGGRVVYARAMGPMQFLPGTWAHYAADGDGDGVADPQNLYDATLAAARYLCSGELDLREPSQVVSAVLRYNNSMSYARNVIGWAEAYATGVVPTDLPPITGSPPPLADIHLENPEGLGPGLPLNIHAVSSTDPLAQIPLIDVGQSVTPDQQPASPGESALSQPPTCTVICIEPQHTLPQEAP